MKKRVLVTVMGILLLLSQTSSAGEIDILVSKLVEKGILSGVEAQIILDETRQEVAKEVSTGKSYATPSWVQKIKIKGDVRLRYQYGRSDSDTEARTRGRVRARLGVEGKVTDDVKVGVGLATGGTDPRSTNQSFGNTFDTPDIRLDYAYAQMKAMQNLKLIAGKFKRKAYLWAPTDLLWDSDINPEGGSFNLTGNAIDDIDYWVNGGIWMLDENGSTDQADPYMKYVQVGVKSKQEVMDRDVDMKFAATHYNFQGIEDTTLDNSEGTNTTLGGALASNFHSLGLSSEVGVRDLFGGLPYKFDDRIALFADFIHNFDDSNVDDELTGWAYGVKFGHKKVKKPGNWQVKYTKAVLGKDAWLDTFPDSDRLGGKTNVYSHELALKYALKKNVILGIDYYHSDTKQGSSDAEDLLQADLVFKF